MQPHHQQHTGESGMVKTEDSKNPVANLFKNIALGLSTGLSMLLATDSEAGRNFSAPGELA